MKGKGFTNDAIPALSLVESPIEGRFAQAFFEVMIAKGFSWEYRAASAASFSVVFSGSKQSPNSMYILEGQVRFPPLDGGRVDFMVYVDNCGLLEYCAVELDGAEFHASPKAQEQDRKRDRLFLLNDSFCLRYLGKEVYADAESCVSEVIDLLDKKADAKETANQFSLSLGFDCGIKRASKMSAVELASVAASIEDFEETKPNEQVFNA